MKRTVVFATVVAILMALVGTIPGSALGGQQPPKKKERHPEIRKAIAACHLAASDLEDASHDFCGHRVEALDATDAAINQLGLAIACDSSVPNPTMMTVTHSTSATSDLAPEAKTKPERHPEIRKAIAALEVAAAALEDASHDFCGHREDALTAVNFAIDQLQAAIACDPHS